MTEHDLGERLARIETKVDLLLEQRVDHETRLRALEKAHTRLLALASTLGAGASLAADYLMRKFT